jgi:hypothetical protein
MNYAKIGNPNQVKRQTRELKKGMRGDQTPFETQQFNPSQPTPYLAHAVSSNNYYTVLHALRITSMGMVKHLMIRRHDGQMENSWRRKQKIKNLLCGENATAIEVYPAESDLVDDANMAHLWVLESSLPFGLHK